MTETVGAVAPGPGDALAIVDLQNDFMPGGALGVRDGDQTLAPLARCAVRFAARGLPVIVTRDWHPADHCSFAAQGGPWPVHCVAGSRGAEFAPGLELPAGALIVSKATSRDEEAYSCFAGTGLHEKLQALGVRRLFIGGLATDYCVLNTVRDARRLGYEITVLRDAVRAVDVAPGDGERAIAEMQSLGARMLATEQLEI